MIYKLLARSHYDLFGTHEGFKLYSLPEKNITENEFYQLLGFKSGQISATEKHKLTKMYNSGELNQLARELNVKVKDVPGVLKGLGCHIKRPHKISSVKHSDLVRVLGAFLRHNDGIVLNIGDTKILLSDLVKNMSISMKSSDELSSILTSSGFIDTVFTVIPEVVYVRGSKPVISRGKFIVPYKLSQVDYKNMVNSALLQAIILFLDVPPAIYFNMMERTAHAQSSSDENYLEMINWAQQLGVTISGLYEKCGLEYIDRLEYFRLNKVFVYKLGQDTYRVMNKNTSTNKQSITLSGRHLNYLHKHKLLSEVNWSKSGVPFVNIGGSDTDLSFILQNSGGFQC